MIRRTNPWADHRNGKGKARRAGALVVLAAAAATLLPAAGANAVDRVDCGNRNDFAKVYDYGYGGRLCCASDGWMAVRIYDVNLSRR
ncbi:hypothetical protein ACIPLC_29965 [Kitasatospora sp. NPDC086801]|uniref:hypothetical protein n=1 Tax=Kitasatospora sp. NPDC086801 TaxID=3364066 RepID=UPI00380A3EB8